jgi:hypothetical protein
MDSHWSSKLWVFKDELGQDNVATSLPPGIVVKPSQIRVYAASGAYPLLGFPESHVVGDVNQWMAELTAKGFSFKPSGLG